VDTQYGDSGRDPSAGEVVFVRVGAGGCLLVVTGVALPFEPAPTRPTARNRRRRTPAGNPSAGLGWSGDRAVISPEPFDRRRTGPSAPMNSIVGVNAIVFDTVHVGGRRHNRRSERDGHVKITHGTHSTASIIARTVSARSAQGKNVHEVPVRSREQRNLMVGRRLCRKLADVSDFAASRRGLGVPSPKEEAIVEELTSHYTGHT